MSIFLEKPQPKRDRILLAQVLVSLGVVILLGTAIYGDWFGVRTEILREFRTIRAIGQEF